MQHRYYVEWSSPNYKFAGGTRVLALNKTDAVKKAKRKIGSSEIKKKHLFRFNALSRFVSPHLVTTK
jgi:hypothetical protein